ncbi:MAG: hypothetical protein H6907_20055 [Hyphomicrobiales bacterium]|nr:hypothetical protein [Hyphomicrobiales bacterium]
MPPPAGDGANHRVAVLFAAVVLVLSVLATGYSLSTVSLAPDEAGTALAVFPPTWPESRGLAAVLAAGGRPVRPVWPGFAWVANGAEAGFVGRLRDAGAVLVLGDLPIGPVLAGCNVNLSGDEIRALVRAGGARRPVTTGAE